MRRPGAAHSVAWKHHKREIQLGSRTQKNVSAIVLMHADSASSMCRRIGSGPKRRQLADNTPKGRYLLPFQEKKDSSLTQGREGLINEEQFVFTTTGSGKYQYTSSVSGLRILPHELITVMHSLNIDADYEDSSFLPHRSVPHDTTRAEMKGTTYEVSEDRLIALLVADQRVAPNTECRLSTDGVQSNLRHGFGCCSNTTVRRLNLEQNDEEHNVARGSQCRLPLQYASMLYKGYNEMLEKSDRIIPQPCMYAPSSIEIYDQPSSSSGPVGVGFILPLKRYSLGLIVIQMILDLTNDDNTPLGFLFIDLHCAVMLADWLDHKLDAPKLARLNSFSKSKAFRQHADSCDFVDEVELISQFHWSTRRKTVHFIMLETVVVVLVCVLARNYRLQWSLDTQLQKTTFRMQRMETVLSYRELVLQFCANKITEYVQAAERNQSIYSHDRVDRFSTQIQMKFLSKKSRGKYVYLDTLIKTGRAVEYKGKTAKMAVYFTLPKIMLGRKLSLFPYRQDVRTLCLCFSVEIKVWGYEISDWTFSRWSKIVRVNHVADQPLMAVILHPTNNWKFALLIVFCNNEARIARKLALKAWFGIVVLHVVKIRGFGSNHYPSDPQSEFRIKLLSLAVDQMVDELFADLVLGLMVLSSYEDIVNACFGSNHYPSDPQSEFRIKPLSLAVDQMVDELFADLVLGLMVLSSYEGIVNAWFVRRAYGRPLFNH
ncbi:hypothetical protein CLF_109803 [Clonorchis sinensis]|uniref:Uncharacterized protein n=1 Tax=Clonorchis sinensis TaxID=79923 RepID=G7YSX9_CLOSI|nr:hypothetical protein CLF_109803 [Clonorchis sinensis]